MAFVRFILLNYFFSDLDPGNRCHHSKDVEFLWMMIDTLTVPYEPPLFAEERNSLGLETFFHQKQN